MKRECVGLRTFSMSLLKSQKRERQHPPTAHKHTETISQVLSSPCLKAEGEICNYTPGSQEHYLFFSLIPVIFIHSTSQVSPHSPLFPSADHWIQMEFERPRIRRSYYLFILIHLSCLPVLLVTFYRGRHLLTLSTYKLGVERERFGLPLPAPPSPRLPGRWSILATAG